VDEFQNVFKNFRFKTNRDDITKLIDKYINTVGQTIDTVIFIQHMRNLAMEETGITSHRIGKILQSDVTVKVAKKLEKKRLSQKVIRNLEKADPKETHFLTLEEIKQAFHDADFKLSTDQVIEILSEIKQNREEEYNYHILLCTLFGTDYKKEIRIAGTPSKTFYNKKDNRLSKSGHDKGGRSDRSMRDRSERHKSEKERSERHGSDRKSARDSPRSKSRARDGDSHRSKSRHGDDRSKSRHRDTNGSRSKSRRREHSKSQSRHHDGSRSKSRLNEKYPIKHGDERSATKHDDKKSKSHGRRTEVNSKPKSRDVGSKRGTRSSNRGRSRAPLGKQAKDVGKRLENSRYSYIDYLKHFAGEDKDYILTDYQIFKLLEAAKIDLSKSEKEDFIRDMGDTRFTVEEFLMNCDLNPKAFGHNAVSKRIILTTEEEEEVKKLLTQIGLAIEDERKEFERVFNIGPYDKNVDFSEFKHGILRELNDESNRIGNDKKSITLLKNFLVEDINKNDKVEIKHLYIHLFPSGEGKPETKTKMNCITDFIDFFKQNPDIEIDKVFKERMTHEEFEKSLQDICFEATKENISKLIDAFTNSKDPGNISKNLIKRNVNLLAPEVVNKDKSVNRKDVDDRFSHIDPRDKTTLTKICEYLKRERIDTLTFFEQCDRDGDGTLSEDEF
jgi:hypothetical protein